MKRCLLVSLVVFACTHFAAANIYTVTKTTDSGPGTFRQAILSANGHANAGPNNPDQIHFNIPGAGLHTITPATPLPPITDPVIIDAFTQPGSKANTRAVGNDSVHLIELNGKGAAQLALVITGGGSTVRGLVINNFNGNGPTNAITLQVKGKNTIEGCFLGLNAAGTAPATNRDYGVLIQSSPGNLIGGTTPAARNVISGNNTGIQVSDPGSAGTIIQGNYLGTNAAGNAAAGSSVSGIGVGYNGDGTGASNTLIGGTAAGAGNVISGFPSIGIKLFDGTMTGVVVQGNYIGTNAAGTAAIGNGTGISLVRTNNVLIGGTAAGAGNLISGNYAGIDSIGDSNTIQGNLIGTDRTGKKAVSSVGLGVRFDGNDNLVGGTVPGARNVISGNGSGGNDHGIRFTLGTATAGNRIQGNYIGTDITGKAAVGNGGSGIQVFAFSEPTGVNTIGGTTPAARNIISGNKDNGIQLSSSNIHIEGNYIGTDVNGTGDLGNGLNGIVVEDSNSTIGGTAAGAGNVIAFNGQRGQGTIYSNGVAVLIGTGTAILGNSIFSNVRLGIDLSTQGENSFGVTPNDDGDADTGVNNAQNYPVLKNATIEGNDLHVTGTLNSTPGTAFRIEFFGNDRIDLSGFGEGQTYLGSTNVNTNASGNAAFDVVLPNAAGQRITSTATDPSGNTSEFSASLGQLLNVSTRLRVQTGDNVLIAGFIITGPEPKKVIARALGPSLAGPSVPDPLQDPTLELHDGNGGLIAFNDNWKDTQQAAIKATGIPPTSDSESAIVKTLPGGASAYTAIVRGKNDTTGTALVEVYDLDAGANSELANVSTRGLVEGGNNVLIGGFIAGNGLTRIIIRALGPSLDVSQPLPDPILELHDSNGGIVATNDNWRDTQQAEIVATQIPPKNNAESAIVATLAPGGYTGVVRDVNSAVGVALVEVYRLR